MEKSLNLQYSKHWNTRRNKYDICFVNNRSTVQLSRCFHEFSFILAVLLHKFQDLQQRRPYRYMTNHWTLKKLGVGDAMVFIGVGIFFTASRRSGKMFIATQKCFQDIFHVHVRQEISFFKAIGRNNFLKKPQHKQINKPCPSSPFI